MMRYLHVFLIRHAEREKSGEHITAEGERRAVDLGRELRNQYLEGAFIALCSQRIRAHETLEAILRGGGLREVPVQEEAFLQNDVSSEFDKQWTHQEEQVHKDAGVDHYLQFGNHKPDAGTISPREVSERISRIIWRYIRPAEGFSLPSPTCIFIVTHSGIVELFLAHVLLRREKDSTIRGFRQVKDIGGILDYLEVAHLHIEVYDDGSMLGHLLLRGQEYGADMKELFRLANP